MTKMTDLRIEQATVTINTALSQLTSLRSKYVSVADVVKDSIDAINKASKEAKKTIATSFKTLTAGECVNVANTLGKSPYGADDALRQVYQRRRGWMKTELERTFPEYDFPTNRGEFSTPVLIGNSREREARAIHAQLSGLKDQGFTLEMSLDQIKAKLGQPVVEMAATDDLPSVKDMLAGIAHKLTAGTSANQEAESEETKQVNQA